MRQTRRTALVCALLAASAIATPAGDATAQNAQGVEFRNPTGKLASFSPSGTIDLTGTFFQTLGTNGRSCSTCHLPSDGWGLSARTAQALFDQTGGSHPLFAFDGQNGPGLDRSTLAARRNASSLMLDRALVRLIIGPLPLLPPPQYEFEITAHESTYGNPVSNNPRAMVVFRRPLPTSNLDTLATAFWDGLGDFLPVDRVLQASLPLGAALHLQADPTFTPTLGQVVEVFTLMRSVSSAQTKDDQAKGLTESGALGGPENLSRLPLIGPPGSTVYNTWQSVLGGGTNVARRGVARGEALFNAKAKCADCHNSPNRGNAAQSGQFIDLGLSDADRRTPGLPLYTLRCVATTIDCNVGDTKQTTDPGRAIHTGKWADIGRFKVPNLRGLAARAPYFHNGFATTLDEVVEFYDAKFRLGLTSQEKADLVNFLRAL